MLLTTIIEGIGLGALLVLVCAIGIRKGAVGLLHLYEPAVQERCISMGLTTKEHRGPLQVPRRCDAGLPPWELPRV